MSDTTDFPRPTLRPNDRVRIATAFLRALGITGDHAPYNIGGTVVGESGEFSGRINVHWDDGPTEPIHPSNLERLP